MHWRINFPLKNTTPSFLAVSRCEIFCYFLFFYSFDTLVVSKRRTNFFYYFFVVFNFLFFWNVGWFSSARAFYNIFIVVIEVLTSSISSVTILSFSVNIISAFSRNPLFVRNGLINFQKFLLLWTPVFYTLLKYTLIAFRRRDTHLFLCFLYIALFSSVGFLLYLFFNFLLSVYFFP